MPASTSSTKPSGFRACEQLRAVFRSAAAHAGVIQTYLRARAKLFENLPAADCARQGLYARPGHVFRSAAARVGDREDVRRLLDLLAP
mmetsp:Transcript_33591/g.104045  ORF Transcript_33591/g.104045 Transcript_33591/m.104045 type:complete len:88 (+) Transcript_33591:513-776(+)